MSKEYVLTLTAANRIGILAAVSTGIAELGGDVRQIDVSVMRRFFTIILSADFPDERKPDVIVDHLRGIGRPYGLEVVLNDPETTPLQEPPRSAETYYLTLTGSNQPGTMRQIASRLTQEGVDISDLYAVRGEDGATFRMLLELVVPPGVDPADLSAAMESLNDETTISAHLQSAEEFLGAGAAVPLRLRL